MSNKLELTWFGKEKEIKLEPRILIEDASKSYSKLNPGNLSNKDNGIYDNILIHGDNLLALKALEQEYSNKVKCVYIDPPYNTGSAFEHYDDNLEHSIWLSLMKPRLELLKKLLSDDGTIWIQIDYNEFAYLKVLCDEIFGRTNFISMISVKSKAPGGVGQESYLFDLLEYILVYRKSEHCANNNVPYIEETLGENITNVYNKIVSDFGEEQFIKTITGGNVGDINVYTYKDFKIDTITRENRTKEKYYENYDFIFRTTNPQGGLMKRVMPQLPNDELVSIEYIPSKGRSAGEKYKYYFYKGSLIVWLKDTAIRNEKRKEVLKLFRNNNLWDDNLHQGIAKEGGVDFKQSKKPEKLIHRILEIATNPGDIVLDSFLGSGTTAAVAHKMKRRWIGIEFGDHAYTHCKVRLDKVIGGEQGGISKLVNWNGGGGYKFYELAPTLIKKDAFDEEIINPEYNGEMLASAIAKHEGYFYQPDAECYWKQAYNETNSYLYVTTRHVNRDMIESIKQEMEEGEFLLIVCKSYDANACLGYEKSVTIKKIPQSLLKNCEFGVDNYNLNIICPPEYEEKEEDYESFK